MDSAKKPTRPHRSGSFMSERQIGRQAAGQKKIAFLTLMGDIRGYVVGADDYHWLVAEAGPYSLNLVHKSAQIVRLLDVSLDDENEEIAKKIREVGAAYWAHCQRAYVGHSVPSTEEQQ